MNIFPTFKLRKKKRCTTQEMPMQELINRLSKCGTTPTVTVHWGQYIHETKKLYRKYEHTWTERGSCKDPDNGLPVTINLVVYPDPDSTFWDLCHPRVLTSPSTFDEPADY